MIDKALWMATRLATLVFSTMILLGGCGEGPQESHKPLPTEKPEAVVSKFYEYISEAGIRGGTIPIKEAYKMVSPATRMSQQRFVGIVKKYPPGFKAEIVDSRIKEKERQAVVTIEYRMASMFGKGYKVSTRLPLVVDEEKGVWLIDFTGESDDQDAAAMKKNTAKVK